jgi:hypothetical protein
MEANTRTKDSDLNVPRYSCFATTLAREQGGDADPQSPKA